MPARHRTATFDLEEITPNHFVINTEAAYGVLKGEGERRGRVFELTSWRRAGLLARLAAREFNVLSLEKRIAGLPQLPMPLDHGPAVWRPLASENERYSVFDLASYAWQPLANELRADRLGVTLNPGAVVRRRKGRGLASFLIAQAANAGSLSLRPVDETSALLQGYAQAEQRQPLTITPLRDAGHVLLSLPPLPQSYREFMRRLGSEAAAGWQIADAGLPFATLALARLGVVVEPQAD